MEKISIIIPLYNCEKYIRDTLDSVLKQMFLNFEIIIVDDCSNDGSAEIVATYSDERIKYIRLSENQGVAKARNIGIVNATGEYIAFLDSDDIWDEKKLVMQYEYMKNKNLDLSYTSYSLIDASNNMIKSRVNVPNEIDYSGLLSGNVIACSTVMARRECIRLVHFKSQKHEDYIMWLYLAREKVRMGGLSEVLMHYRKHEKSITSDKFKSATWVWSIYRNVEHLSLVKSIFYFCKYTIKGIKKHYLK